MMTMPDTQGTGAPAAGIDTESQATGGGAKGQIRQVKEQVVDQAKNSFRQARERATSSLADSKRQAADQVGGLATALHSAGQHLRGEQQERIAGLADSFAEQVDQVASYLRDADLQRLARDVEGLARRQPALVFGAAFAIGLLGARFLKSSEVRGVRGEDYDDYEEYGGYETIQPGGQAAGLGYDPYGTESLGTEPLSPTPRSTMGGQNAGA
jgi:hypothetical protein